MVVLWYIQTVQSNFSIRGEYISYPPPRRCISYNLEPWYKLIAPLRIRSVWVLGPLALGCVNPIPASTSWCNLYIDATHWKTFAYNKTTLVLMWWEKQTSVATSAFIPVHERFHFNNVLLLTLSVHARGGYSSCLVCLSVMLWFWILLAINRWFRYELT